MSETPKPKKPVKRLAKRRRTKSDAVLDAARAVQAVGQAAVVAYKTVRPLINKVLKKRAARQAAKKKQ